MLTPFRAAVDPATDASRFRNPPDWKNQTLPCPELSYASLSACLLVSMSVCLSFCPSVCLLACVFVLCCLYLFFCWLFHGIDLVICSLACVCTVFVLLALF